MIKQQELRWKDVREEVAVLNPKLSAIIDHINPSNKYTLIKVKYPFGAEILRKAELYLPDDEHHLVPLKSNQVEGHIKDCLGYNFGSNPVGLSLKNSVELFIDLEDRVIPYAIVPPGNVFGAWRILDTTVSHCPPTFLWGMTAGARSLFMLAKISEAISHTQLSKLYQLKVEKPKNLIDHWEVFREIANHKNFGEPWEVELLFFTGKWFEKLHDKEWEKFKLYLLDSAWQSSSYWRNQYIWGFVFSLFQKNRHIKTSSYIADIVKHLLAIAVGALPGFRPATDNSLGPISQLQETYVNDYRLKDYSPIIMQPAFFSILEQCPSVYYSLQYPTSLEFSLKSSDRTSAITDLYLVVLLIKKYIAEIKSGTLNISGTPLETVVKKVEFEFFHNNTNGHFDIQESLIIPNGDISFAKAAGKYNDREFPKNSPFFNGCARISHK